MKISQLSKLCIVCLLCLAPTAGFAQPYTISKDGSKVTDQKTGLIWRRCAEGMKWNGKTCTGVPVSVMRPAALELALAEATRTSTDWRLPNSDELASLVDRNLDSPTINRKAFPATPASSFWTSSPAFGDSFFHYAWFVNFDDGTTHQDLDRDISYHVRLVRSAK